MMSKNSLALTSALVNKLLKVGNISVPPFCTKLSESASFFVNTSVVFLSAKMLVQNSCKDLLY